MSTGHTKKLHYSNLHLPILQLPISIISIDLLGPYHETENGNQYALTLIYMLTNDIFMIPIKSKTTEEVIKVYLKDVCSTF